MARQGYGKAGFPSCVASRDVEAARQLQMEREEIIMPASRILTAAFASAILLGGAGSAFAAWDSDQNYEYLDWVNSKVTTADAARIAEQATGGTAGYVTFDSYPDYGVSVYRVDTQSANEVATVEIDAETGAVREVARVAAPGDLSSGDLAELPGAGIPAPSSPSPSDNP
jgi:uncharacterized membrane protein YkoI